jgi:biopolymer transport protein ExbD
MAQAKSHQKKMSVRVDFTPMVDMNMLLITFFMLCTTMIKSQTLQISLPSNDKVDKTEQNKVKESEAITVILDSDVDGKGKPTMNYVYYYTGMPDLAADGAGNLTNNKMKEVKFDAGEASQNFPMKVRAILQQRNDEVLQKINKLKADYRAKKLTDEQYQAQAKVVRNDDNLKRPVVIIKATPRASFMSLVSALDEMQINSISRYQVDNMNMSDSAMIKSYWQKRLATHK